MMTAVGYDQFKDIMDQVVELYLKLFEEVPSEDA